MTTVRFDLVRAAEPDRRLVITDSDCARAAVLYNMIQGSFRFLLYRTRSSVHSILDTQVFNTTDLYYTRTRTQSTVRTGTTSTIHTFR